MRYKARASNNPLPPLPPGPTLSSGRYNLPFKHSRSRHGERVLYPSFFVVLREMLALEAITIVSVLLSVAERITNVRLPGDSLPTTVGEEKGEYHDWS